MANKSLVRIVDAHEAPLTQTMTVKRVFPGPGFKNIDPFVFLDHFGPHFHDLAGSPFAGGTGAHPHRGFCTFTYLFDGEMEHADSQGHRGVIGAGGVQWMKAGKGIVHDEKPPRAFLEKGGILDGLQLWINLPAAHKGDIPAYMALDNRQVPEAKLEGGVLRILIGEYGGLQSDIPAYSSMLVGHLMLEAGKECAIGIPEGWNVGLYQRRGTLQLEGVPLAQGRLAVLSREGDQIRVANPSDLPQDTILLAGKPIGEPIYASGPFVMDTIEGINTAFADFHAGKYGVV